MDHPAFNPIRQFSSATHFLESFTAVHGGIDVHNPFNGERLGSVARCGENEVREAIDASVRAQRVWRELPAQSRSNYLARLARLVRERSTELAKLLTLEQGKPLREAEAEIEYGAAYFEWFAGEAVRVYGDVIPAPVPGKRLFVVKEPIGVAAFITPWNFPQAMIARKLGAALAAGCTAICKPAPETPFSALALEALVREAGVPEGVFQIVTGDAAVIGETLMASPSVRKVSFTGSTEVGKLLYAQSASTLKKLTLELGGNAPFILFQDGDVERAAADAIFAKYRNAGQTCVCVNRFYVHEHLYERFVDRFVAGTKALRVGNGLERDTDIGPLISTRAVQKVRGLVEDALHKGAHLIEGVLPNDSTLLVAPIIITGVTNDMEISHTEIFGPVAAISRFKTDEEALRLANATDSGLVAYFYTADVDRAFRVSDALEAGIVGINDTRISLPQAPFGGIKNSGFGREGSKYGVDEYLQCKYLCWGVQQ